MRKHNDGYALVLVLVVMVVLCLVALALMSNSLRNLQSQQKSIERMEDKYAAEGAVEIVVAELNGLDCEVTETDLKSSLPEICSKASNGDIVVSASGCTLAYDPEVDEGNFTYKFTLSVQSNLVLVTCDLELAGTVDASKKIVSPHTSYVSFDISNATSTEGGDGE